MAQVQSQAGTEYTQLLTRLDTVSQWIERKPQWERLDRFRTSPLFDSLIIKIEEELLLILNHPLAKDKLPLNKYLSILESPDRKLRLVNCGSSNIYGTGNYYLNFVQVIEDGEVKAMKFPGDLKYFAIDTLQFKQSTIYLFSGQTIHTTRFEVSSYSTYIISNLQLQPYSSFGLEHSIDLVHDWMSMGGGYELNFHSRFRTIDIQLEVFDVYGDETVLGLPSKSVNSAEVYPAKLNGFLVFADGAFVWVDYGRN